MSRLTRKLNEGFYVGFVPNTDTLKIKLGRIEDLMERYNINDLIELKIALDYYEQTKKVEKLTANAEIDTFKEIQDLLTKANTYDKLSNELGCPLEVVVEALKELGQNIIYEWQDRINEMYHEDTPSDEFCLVYCVPYGATHFEYCFTFKDDVGIERCLRLKDYGKTWWLKGNLEEVDNET